MNSLGFYISVYQEEFENIEMVIRICKLKDRQHNGQKKKDKRTNNDLQNITHKTTDRITRTPLKSGGELRWNLVCYWSIHIWLLTMFEQIISFWFTEATESACFWNLAVTFSTSMAKGVASTDAWFMVVNATFNNISVISWRSVVLVEETGVPRENHWPVASHSQTLTHNVVLSTPFHELASNSQLQWE